MTTIPASMALNAYARAAGMGGNVQTPQAGAAGQANGAFGDMLKQAMNEAINTAKAGETQMAAVTGGTGGNIVDVVTAVAEAESTLQTVVTVRDKVITAYQEIMRMPI
ncbi:flagellar hook-basal body complex protein FliE [Parvibaculum sp.]|jgi:flagellar hook-basal body complex protein FliE|uniref:flagellar hook-basal body complex protein FliE n=1 Tax=Parvibaculum sp. TaxID=2024848 RepID=UPI002A34EC0E|nr:flagellar hook-basal body complex protein FliE [Parvibaculum sp.]